MAKPIAPDENESYSVDVRKIENGYVTRTSVYGSGDYKSTEVFSATKPDLDAPKAPRQSGGSSLRDACRSLK